MPECKNVKLKTVDEVKVPETPRSCGDGESNSPKGLCVQNAKLINQVIATLLVITCGYEVRSCWLLHVCIDLP